MKWNVPARHTVFVTAEATEARSESLSSGNTTSYTYNGHGLRSSATSGTTTNHFAWDSLAGSPLLLSDGTYDFIFGPGGSPIEQINTSTGTPTYLYTDRLGSIVLEADSSGSVLGKQSYNAYGTVASESGTGGSPFGFAGGYTDGTGLIYLIHRYYDAQTGQFVSVDMLKRETGQAYSYTSDDPLNRTDPSGLASLPCVRSHYKILRPLDLGGFTQEENGGDWLACGIELTYFQCSSYIPINQTKALATLVQNAYGFFEALTNNGIIWALATFNKFVQAGITQAESTNCTGQFAKLCDTIFVTIQVPWSPDSGVPGSLCDDLIV